MKLCSILLILAFVLQACYKQSCSCQITCAYFNRDSVVICSSAYSGLGSFQMAADSLGRIYSGYPPYDSVTKNVYIGESFGLNASQNNRMKQLESQGYSCICAK